MIQKIREKIDSWDFKAILQTSFALAIIFFVVFYFLTMRGRLREADKETFKGQTTGKVISVTPKEVMSQTRSRGTEIYTDSYDVLYKYIVNGQLYQQTDNIRLTVANKRFLNRISKGSDEPVVVAFDLNDPKNSILMEGR